ncbi:uncharacterized protein LOC121524223 isoform X2 [Cheilinus undulatus]|uniref:uncharacterized protein LOC121524223 isoform X2 n=1 Tax=Cheilinus undulatus TaxID=241271 RepID=UPI001BD27188|nr:uncharacterized protein LOC121524223 isoform X2 [Cheilinus undulatus]
MSHLQLLRLFISERLSVAAEEIFAAVHRTLTEYEQDSEQHRAKHEMCKQSSSVRTSQNSGLGRVRRAARIPVRTRRTVLGWSQTIKQSSRKIKSYGAAQENSSCWTWRTLAPGL